MIWGWSWCGQVFSTWLPVSDWGNVGRVSPLPTCTCSRHRHQYNNNRSPLDTCLHRLTVLTAQSKYAGTVSRSVDTAYSWDQCCVILLITDRNANCYSLEFINLYTLQSHNDIQRYFNFSPYKFTNSFPNAFYGFCSSVSITGWFQDFFLPSWSITSGILMADFVWCECDLCQLEKLK